MGGSFSPREVLVAQLVARGATNREAAAALGLSAKTVEWHLSRLLSQGRRSFAHELALAWRSRGPARSLSKVAAQEEG